MKSIETIIAAILITINGSFYAQNGTTQKFNLNNSTPLINTLVQTNDFSDQTPLAKQDSLTKRTIKINWEFAMGPSYFTNTDALPVQQSGNFSSTSYHYYTSVKIPMLASSNRFGFRLGVGPNVKNFGVNKLLSVNNNSLSFSDLPSNTNIKAVTFQQVNIDFPVYLYYETKSGKHGYCLAMEWGGIFAIQASNKWKTYEVNNGLTSISYQEDIPNTRDFQFGNSVKLALVKNTKFVSSGLFLQGTYYSTSTFKPSVKIPTNNYDVRLGFYITLNKL